jgi:hypothetical protein
MPLSNFSLPNAPGPDIVPLASFIELNNSRKSRNQEFESFQILEWWKHLWYNENKIHIYKQKLGNTDKGCTLYPFTADSIMPMTSNFHPFFWAYFSYL